MATADVLQEINLHLISLLQRRTLMLPLIGFAKLFLGSESQAEAQSPALLLFPVVFLVLWDVWIRTLLPGYSVQRRVWTSLRSYDASSQKLFTGSGLSGTDGR